MMSRNVKILATIVLVGAGAVFIASQSAGDAEYFNPVDVLLREPQRWVGKSLAVQGYVVPGSMRETVVGQKTEREFRIQMNGQALAVHHVGAAPDALKDQAEVVVKGRLATRPEGLVLEAIAGESGIVCKCPSKYEGRR